MWSDVAPILESIDTVAELTSAEEDRRLLFGEAQQVEQRMREEKARKAEAQADASHFRDLLRSQM